MNSRLAVINVVGLSQRLLGERMPFLTKRAEQNGLSKIQPAFPAVTCTAQSNYLTGSRPEKHGIVANGWFDRPLNEPQFWKQSNRMVEAPKIWEILKQRDPAFTCANSFWWFNMATKADYSVTPRPIYRADGGKLFDIATAPLDLRERMKSELGPFPFHTFWGPGAGIASSEWIARSAVWMEKQFKPTLQLIYLPHFDYNFQRFGPSDERSQLDLTLVDRVVEELTHNLEKQGVRTLFLSEYSITPVNRPVHLNRVLREKGWISIKDEAGKEMLDFGTSPAFAIADHQIAHIYVLDSTKIEAVREVLRAIPGVKRVLGEAELAECGLKHARCGDLVAEAEPDSWFTYYYWFDHNKAPDFARTVDIHRKPGYDPAELFLDPQLRFPKLKIAQFLLKKKLGFRAMLEVIPLDAGLIKGSHGHIPEDPQDWPILIGGTNRSESIESTDVASEMRSLLGYPEVVTSQKNESLVKSR